MKLNSEECEALLSSGVHHVSPSSRPWSKSDLVEMDSTYSPTRKASKSELKSRVHCIPVLMVLVFFVLWAASSGTSALFLRLHCSDGFQFDTLLVSSPLSMPSKASAFPEYFTQHLKKEKSGGLPTVFVLQLSFQVSIWD